jgi:hypothetical protein
LSAKVVPGVLWSASMHGAAARRVADFRRGSLCLLGWDESGETARLLFPETGQGSVQLSRDELRQRYSGVAIFARPHFRFDSRTPEVGDVKLAPLVLG